MALVVDGSVRQTDAGAATSLATGAFNNTITNDVIVIDVFIEVQSSAGSAATSTVTSALAGWTLQSRISFQQTSLGNNFVTIERWFNIDPGTNSATVTATINAGRTADDITLVGTAWSGARTTAPIFDPGVNASKSALSHAASAPSLSGFTTTYDKTVLLMSASSSSNTGGANIPPTQTTGSGGSGTWTMLNTFTNADNVAWLTSAAEYSVVAVVQSNISPSFGTSWAEWVMQGDALLDATAVLVTIPAPSVKMPSRLILLKMEDQ